MKGAAYLYSYVQNVRATLYCSGQYYIVMRLAQLCGRITAVNHQLGLLQDQTIVKIAVIGHNYEGVGCAYRLAG